MQILSHETDNTDSEQKLNTINLSLKSMYGDQKNRFYQIYSTVENNNNRIATITNQVNLLTTVLKNMARITNEIKLVWRSYYQFKYHTQYLSRYNKAIADYSTPYCESCDTCDGCNSGNILCNTCQGCESCETGN